MEPDVAQEKPERPPASPLSLVVLGLMGPGIVMVLGSRRATIAVTITLNVIFLVYFVRHVAFAAAAVRWAPKDLYEGVDLDMGYWPTVTALVAAHNEALVVEGVARSMLSLWYPEGRLQIIIVDDRSTDETGEILDRLAGEEPRLQIIHREQGAPGGKSAALNAGLEHVTGEIVVIFDADHRARRNVLMRLVRHFNDPSVATVQGRCIVYNSVESRLARAVAIDYFSGYLVNEYGRQALFGLPAYGGANCAVRTSVLRELGGWNQKSVTEDTDLTMRVRLTGRRICYDISAVDTEQATNTLSRFCQQRYRWARGHQQVWRDYHRNVWRSPHLGLIEKIETTLFLLVFHLPVVCALGVVLTMARLLGVGYPVTVFELLPLAALLFAGPFCELACGLLVGRAPKRASWSVMWLTPIFFIFMVVCSKAWLDGTLGRPYAWIKTRRSHWSPTHGIAA
jgi:cellulose synthase/poly-beta-1,6-N-acetylglucosamine synthase-like glycosyltransferase